MSDEPKVPEGVTAATLIAINHAIDLQDMHSEACSSGDCQTAVALLSIVEQLRQKAQAEIVLHKLVGPGPAATFLQSFLTGADDSQERAIASCVAEQVYRVITGAEMEGSVDGE